MVLEGGYGPPFLSSRLSWVDMGLGVVACGLLCSFASWLMARSTFWFCSRLALVGQCFVDFCRVAGFPS